MNNSYDDAMGDTTPNPGLVDYAPKAGRDAVPARARRYPVVGTIVFGLVMLTISVLSLVGLLTDIKVDSGLVGLGLLIGAGLVLVAGGAATAVRESKHDQP
jgi:hypothetical protein